MTGNAALRETLQHVLLKKQNLTRGNGKGLDQKLYDEYSEVEALLMEALNARASKQPKSDAEREQSPAPDAPAKVGAVKNPYGKYARKG